MKIARNFLAAMIALLGICMVNILYAQGPADCGKGTSSSGTKGQDFLLVFMANEEPGVDSISSETYQDIYIASVDDTATVTITCGAYRNAADTIVKKLNAHDGITVPISRLFTNRNYLVFYSEMIDATVIHIVSTSPIICYGMNHKRATADAFLALPKTVAASSTAYMAMCYPASTNTPLFPNKHPGEFAVAAFENNTTVTITPTCPTANGSPAGQPMTFTLNAVECVQIQSSLDDGADLTGSMIVANKPIAVYSGHRRTEVPTNYIYENGSTSSRDHLAEAVPPIDTWGYNFITGNFKTRPIGDLMRVLARDNGTEVTVNGVLWRTLNAGQHADTMIDFNPDLIKNVVTVSTKKPVMVAMLAHTTNINNGPGDPFLAIVPPIEQAYNDLSYFISSDTKYDQGNTLMVATDAAGVGRLSLTDPAGTTTTYPAGSYSPLVSVGTLTDKYSMAWINQNASGFWRITSPSSGKNKGMVILAYGFGGVDSYGYTAGSLFNAISGIMVVGNNPAVPYPGSTKVPSTKIMNILADPIYFDSITIDYTSNPNNIPVTIKGMEARPLGRLEGAQEKQLIFTPAIKSDEPIVGTATLHYHSGLWQDLTPEVIPFRIESGAIASVKVEKETMGITIFPNPIHGKNATLSLTMPSSANATVTLFDELGREIGKVFDSKLSEGPQSLSLPTSQFRSGTYYYEMNIRELNISYHGTFLVVN